MMTFKFHIMFIIMAVVFILPSVSSFAQQEDDYDQINIFEEDVKEKRVEKLLVFLEKSNPQKARQLQELRREDPERFDVEIEEFMESMREKMRSQRMKPQTDAVTRATDQGDWQQPRKTQSPGDDDESKQRRPGRHTNRNAPDEEIMPPREPGQMGMGRGRKSGQDSYKEVMRKRNEQFIEWLGENFPSEAEKLQQATEADPETAFRYIMPVMMKYRDIFETEKKNPELASLMKKDIELKDMRDRLVEQIHSTPADETEQLREQLSDVVAARFELILDKRRMRFEELAQRLEQLENEIARQKQDLRVLEEQRQEQIDNRLQELLAEDRKIRWD
jgi:hypothetical protein